MPEFPRNILALAGFFAICFSVAGIGAVATVSSVDTWYPTLVKPPFNPPDWIFGPVWTFLYALIATAGWRVWRSPSGPMRRRGLVLYSLQLALNLLWSILFFGLHLTGLALVEILLLLVVIAVTGRIFYRVDCMAGLLFIPYLLWVGFASLLNFAIWILN